MSKSQNNSKLRKSSTEERKPDTTRNTSGIDELIAKQREREKNLYPVRVSNTTVIYVTKKKVTQQYAEDYKRTKLMKLE